MSREGPRLPPLVCRICRPYVGFFRYSVFRAHVRAEHQIRQINDANLRQFETYPGGSLDVIRDPPSRRNRVEASATVAVDSGQPSNAVNQNLLASAPDPNGMPSVAQAAEVNMDAGSSSVQQKTAVSSGLGKSDDADASVLVSERSLVAASTSSQHSGVMFTAEQLRAIIQAEMKDMLKQRLPSLGSEFQIRVDETVRKAMEKDVPAMVGSLLVRAAEAYASDGAASTSRRSIGSNTSVERRCEQSGLNVRVSVDNTAAAIEEQTDSDDELSRVSQSLIDGSILTLVSIRSLGSDVGSGFLCTLF